MSEALLDQAAFALQRGDLRRAETAYREVLKTDARNFEACDGLASILAKRGQAAEAALLYEQALALQPDDAIALSNYGGVLDALGRPAEALVQYDRALASQPDFPDAMLNRTGALCALERYSEALESLDRLAARTPGHPVALYNRGVALAGLERFEEALKAYDAALAIEPNYPEAWGNRGVSLSQLKRFAEAVVSFDRALALNPAMSQAHVNRGGALAALARYPEALAAYDRALALDPNAAYALFNRGVMLTELKRTPEAITSYEQALKLVPDYGQAAYNLALCQLQLGRMEEGFRGYETRRRLALDPALYSQPFWSGEDISGKTLLVRGEQGLGDIIQFSRYVRLLQDRGVTVILMVQPHIARLLRSLDPAPQIIAWTETPPAFDYHIALESLPGLFNTRLDTIPAAVPYLAAEPALVAKWKQKLGPEDLKARGFKIGIAWRSSAHGASIGKTFSPAHFAVLSKIPGTRLISLQKDDESGELNDLPPDMVVERLGADFDAGPDAFLDSAAVMASLDLVISSDTAIAHLAGALGLPVWMALKYIPDWRWLLDRADTPWYSTMRLFRQPASGDWAGAFAQIAAALADAARPG